MRCLTCICYVACVNRELTTMVVPSRGIWRRDPISPYLFLLCTEVLSCVYNKGRTKVSSVVSSKEILSIHNYFFFARKFYHVCCNKGRTEVSSVVFAMVDLVPQSPTYFLSMTVSSLRGVMIGVWMF
jgi:hypothetical protein